MLFIQHLLPILLAWNSVTFLVVRKDKRAAIKGKRRTPESTLLFIAFLFGAFGVYAGMYFFRHKTKHLKFVVLIPAFCLLHIFMIHRVFTLLQ